MKKWWCTYTIAALIWGGGFAAADGKCYQIYDPNESWNRKVHAFNITLDKYLVNPPVKIYRKMTPTFVQNRVSNVFGNLKAPLTLVNNTLQGDAHSGAVTLWRFIVNSTVGVLGLFDVATYLGVFDSPKTFETTMMKAKYDYGSYIVIPILGPSTSRGVVSRVADFVTDPMNYLLASNHNKNSVIYYTVGSNLNVRINNDDVITLYANELDSYSATKVAYIHSLAKRDKNCDNLRPMYNYDDAN